MFSCLLTQSSVRPTSLCCVVPANGQLDSEIDEVQVGSLRHCYRWGWQDLMNLSMFNYLPFAGSREQCLLMVSAYSF